MKDRRDFLKTSLVVSAGVLVAASSTPTFADTTSFPKGIIYTSENSGKWEGKAGGHLPIVTVDGNQVTIKTKHGMSKKHYIVRHTIVTKDGKVLGEKTFYPSDKDATSVFKIDGKHSELYATSFCNKHDLWVAKFSV